MYSSNNLFILFKLDMKVIIKDISINIRKPNNTILNFADATLIYNINKYKKLTANAIRVLLINFINSSFILFLLFQMK